jgi:hypothetical protein
VDREWLRIAGEKGWIILTKDSRIKNRLNEMQRLLSCDARAFVLVTNELSGSEIGKTFVKALPAMKRLCGRKPAPFIAVLQRSGRVCLA